MVVSTADYALAKKKTTQAKKPATTANRSSSTVKKEQQKTRKEIDDTKKKISENEQQTRNQLTRLEEINGQIAAQEATISNLQSRIEQIESRRIEIADTITGMKDRVGRLKQRLAAALREERVRRHQVNRLGFLFSAKSFAQASRRVNYLRQLDKAMYRQMTSLKLAVDSLAKHEEEMAQLVTTHTNAVKELTDAKYVLDSRRSESKKVVNDLKSEQQTLNKILAEKRAYAKKLDDELDRIIAEETRRKQEEERKRKAQQNQTKPTKPSESGKPSSQTGTTKPEQETITAEAEADRKLTGSFVSNKGRLLFPVAGTYTIVSRFGRSNYDNLDHVEVNNSGIDISVPAGTAVRSVFDGEVSSVFFLNGYENIVIVRHGQYLTVYAGLGKINVSKGAKVKAGQTIGTVATINGRTVLHFEVRKERTKLNPLEWVK